MSSALQGIDTVIFSSFLFSHFFSDSGHLGFLTLLVRVVVFTTFFFCFVLFLLFFYLSLSCIAHPAHPAHPVLLGSTSASVLVALSWPNDFPILNLDILSHKIRRMFKLIHRPSLQPCFSVLGTQ